MAGRSFRLPRPAPRLAHAAVLALVLALAGRAPLRAGDGTPHGDGAKGGAAAVAPALAPKSPKLLDVAGLPVLRLAGTPREMGYQHGVALAAGIKEGIEEFCIRYRCHGIRARYEQIRKRVETEVTFPDAIVDELTGMLEGMKASGVDLAMPLLKRDLEVCDLEMLNSADHWGLFGCSGLTAWGSSTPDGEVLTSRNFDFDADPRTFAIARLGLVLTFEPKGAKAFASFAFPGMVGIVTGVNEEGVACFLHVGNGTFGGGEPGRSLPLTLIGRQLLEESSPAEAAPMVRGLLKEARVRNAFLFRVVTPGKDAPPTTVFEIDSRGFDVQTPPDPAKGEPPLLIATNHYRTREAVFSAIPDSKVRFANLEADAKSCLAHGNHVIDPLEAWASLEVVAQDAPIVTLHALVLLPRTLEMWVAFSKVSERTGRPIAAPHQKPVHVRFLQLLGRT